ncbi:MAG: hypothetical protein R2726_07250 [Acidimicrobiales bacterium]
MAETAPATTDHELAIAALDLARLGARHTASFGRTTARRAVERGRRLGRRARHEARHRRPELVERLRETGWSVWSNESRWSFASVRSQGSMWSVLSLWSFGSVGSAGSVGSLVSIGSAGSVLSIGSAGSILSIGSAGSVLAIGGVNQRPRWLQGDEAAETSPALALVNKGGTVLGALALAAAVAPRR